MKTPVGSLVLIVSSIFFYRARRLLGPHDAILLLVPVSIIFLAATQSKTNIGLRHILPVYPFLFVLASRLGQFHGAFQHDVKTVKVDRLFEIVIRAFFLNRADGCVS